ncbi:MAG: tyrosine-type recombinase/integrase, partial [Akkermansia sp.]|nr:tyrosine-type recombinase/integrase [Akkermansia sp.]
LRLLAGCVVRTGRICPTQWLRHWRELRRQAGFTHWVPDVLRHTFASYHLRHFRNYSELQYETGHRDSSLLRTRYVNMSRLGDVAGFWT